MADKTAMVEANEVANAGTTALVDFTDAQLVAFKALRIDKEEREDFAAKAVAGALRAKISSKITTCVKLIYDERRKNNAGNVAKLEATLKELEAIVERL